MAAEAFKVFLIIGAIIIFGSVVVPRLSGWIFNTKSKSFVWVWFATVLVIQLAYIKYLRSIEEDMGPYAYIGFAILYGIGFVLLWSKEKEDDPFKE